LHEMGDIDKVSKTKLLLGLKSEVIELKLNSETDKQQIEKLNKKFAQLGPVMDGMKDNFSGEVTKVRDELNEEKQTRIKIMHWIRDNLGPSLELIDKRLEIEKKSWIGDVRNMQDEERRKIQTDYVGLLDAEKSRWNLKYQELEERFNSEVKSVRDDFRLTVTKLKESWEEERLGFEEKIKREREEERKFWEAKIDGKIEQLFQDYRNQSQKDFSNLRDVLKDESKKWIGIEVDRVGAEAKEFVEREVQKAREDNRLKWQEELHNSQEQFSQTWRKDLALLRHEEKGWWENERQALREDERKFREGFRQRLLDEILKLQTESLKISASDVSQWLARIGYTQYSEIFAKNGYDSLKLVSMLNEDDLSVLGITQSGHRKALLSAAHELAKDLASPTGPNSFDANGELDADHNDLVSAGRALMARQERRAKDGKKKKLSRQQEDIKRKYEDEENRIWEEEEKRDKIEREEAQRKEREEFDVLEKAEKDREDRERKEREKRESREQHERKDRDEKERRASVEKERREREKKRKG